MITPMTKLTMLIYHRDYKQILTDIRDHGVVHVHTKKETLQDEVLKAKMTEVKHVNNVIKLLSQQSTVNGQQTLTTELRNEELLNCIDSKFAEIDSIQQQIASLQKDDNVYNVWCEFPEDKIKQIQSNNWD